MSFPKVGLGTIHKISADPIIYTGAGLAAGAITGVYCEIDAPTFPGAGKTASQVKFEIQFGDLPGTPAKKDRIEHETGAWSVIDIDPERANGAWVMSVEKAV